MGMKGNASTFSTVKELHLLAAAHDIELDAIWKPRTNIHQQVADAWSKVPDSSDWALHPQVYDQLAQDPILQGRMPTLDVFASSANTKVPDAFYSQYICPAS